MSGYSCVVCGNKSANDKHTSFHCFPSALEKRARWLEAFEITEDLIRGHTRVQPHMWPYACTASYVAIDFTPLQSSHHFNADTA